jgi:hypothetical protein
MLIPGVTIEYSNLDGDYNLEIYRQNRSNPAAIAFENNYPLTDLNQHTFFLEFESSEQYNYILQIDSLAYSDTISDYQYEIKGRNCNARIDNVSYRVNGISQDDLRLDIH